MDMNVHFSEQSHETIHLSKYQLLKKTFYLYTNCNYILLMMTDDSR